MSAPTSTWGLCGRALYVPSVAGSERLARARAHRIVAALLEGPFGLEATPSVQERHGAVYVVVEAEDDGLLDSVERELRRLHTEVPEKQGWPKNRTSTG